MIYDIPRLFLAGQAAGMSRVVGVLPLHRSALPGKLPVNPSDLAVARAPSSCLRRFGSRGATLVASAIATNINSAPTEELFGGLGRHYFAGNHLGNELEDGDVGRRYDEEGYGPVEAGSHNLSIASLDLPRQPVGSLILKKRGIITHLSPIQEFVHPRSEGNLMSSCVGPLVVIANAIYSATSEAAALVGKGSEATFCGFQRRVVPLLDLDPATAAKVAVSVLGPALSAYGFLFILRIVMSWYPKLPVQDFPYVVAFAPTEPLLILTRRLIPPLGGVDVTPVVWFGLISFLNEILVGPQGLLVLLSQQVAAVVSIQRPRSYASHSLSTSWAKVGLRHVCVIMFFFIGSCVSPSLHLSGHFAIRQEREQR